MLPDWSRNRDLSSGSSIKCGPSMSLFRGRLLSSTRGELHTNSLLQPHSPHTQMVCDYYCEVGVRERLVASKFNQPAAVKNVLLDTTFEPEVLLRLPEANRVSVPFTKSVAMFCFPHGVRLIPASEAAERAIPVVSSFVLTSADTCRMYGACIIWYEELPTRVAAHFLDGRRKKWVDDGLLPVHAPEAICLLSRVPIFEALMECCRQLFRMRISSPTCSFGGRLQLRRDGASLATTKFSRAIKPLLHAPLPPIGGACSLPLGNVSVRVVLPSLHELPHTMSGKDFLLLFQAADANLVIMLFALLLTEQRVVLQASQPHVLTMAAETLCALMYPFSWQHVYIPILPVQLFDALQAPMPFLIGIDTEVLTVHETSKLIPQNVVQVDLDAGLLTCDLCLAQQIYLPQKQYQALHKVITPFCRRPCCSPDGSRAATAFPMAPPPESAVGTARRTLADMSEEEVISAVSTIKGAFLQFLVSLMWRYQELMVVPPVTVNQPSAIDYFDIKRWKARFSSRCSDWLGMFATSQAFTQWLEQRLMPSPLTELHVTFFNEALDSKDCRKPMTKFRKSHSMSSIGSSCSSSRELVPADVHAHYRAKIVAQKHRTCKTDKSVPLQYGKKACSTNLQTHAGITSSVRSRQDKENCCICKCLDSILNGR